MTRVKVAAATLNQTPLDWTGNRAHVVAAIEAARATDVDVLCLPELCLTGYGCEDAFLAPWVQRAALELLVGLVPETRGIVVCVGLPIAIRGAVYNASALLVDGRLAGMVCKQALAGDGIHYEPRWFKPWPDGAVETLSVGGVDVPVGDVVFEVGGVRIGFEICEDAWIAQRPGASLARAGVDLILNPSASHFAYGKHDVRRRLVLEGSRAFGCGYVYANLVGNEAGRAIYDGDALVAASGELLAEASRFSFSDHQQVDAVVDVALNRAKRGALWSYQPAVGAEVAQAVRVPFVWRGASRVVSTSAPAPFERTACVKEEETARALSLALFDYLRKSRSMGYVVSLSGGADSSAITCLVALMLRFATDELGIDAVKARLGHIETLRGAVDVRELVGRLLTTVYQSTRNSGSVTRDAARVVADAVGARHLEVDVDALVAGYTSIVEGAEGRTLDWGRDDIALQNIQARVRAPSVWMIANLTGALLLATSNRSEAAVGYATMDGDTSGGLSPIAGLDKAFLRRWLRWLEATGPVGVGPIPALSAVNAQQPTAELRPPGAHQTDEADLMPYDVLDLIERAAIRDRQGPDEVWDVLAAARPETTDVDRLRWVERFFRLWSRNQWKRERYAPSFHLDDESLDPKTWCRFPILSGGFAVELAALRVRVLGAP